METDLIKAQRYRDLAAEMRELANQEANEEAKTTMVTLAEKYEELSNALIDRSISRQE